MKPDNTLNNSDKILSYKCIPIKCSDQPQIRFLVKLAYDLLRSDVFIWILDPSTQRLSGCTSFESDLIDTSYKSLNISNDNIIIRILESNEVVHVTASSQADHAVFSDFFKNSNCAAFHCLPLRLGDKTIGAACYAQEKVRDLMHEEIMLMRQITGLASKILENEFRKREIKSLSNMASLMRSSTNFNQAMQFLVDAARELTGAEYSTLFFFNAKSHSFEVGYRSPYVKTQPTSKPRSKGGLTWKILQTGQSLRVDDTNDAENIRDSVRQRGVLSLIGVQVQFETEKIGVFYINGKRRKQFSDYDTNIIQTLADYASLALGRSRIFLKPTEKIEAALDKIFDFESTLYKMCKEIQKTLSVDFVSIQLIDKKRQVIESIFGTGISKKWIGLSKHYLEKTDYLRDLQADIVQSQCTEILNGNDERLDPYIYNLQDMNIARITTPIMLFRAEDGSLLESWRKECSWKVIANLNENSIPADVRENENVTQFTVIGLCGKENQKTCKLTREVIGTVGAGYNDGKKSIEPEIAIELNKIIAKWAPTIYQTSLQSVLEVIVNCAMDSVKADSATLHLMRNPYKNTYVYEVCAGKIDRGFLMRHPPREEGIGWKSIVEETPRFIPDLASGQKLDHLKNVNPKIYNEGIKAIAAFPLIVDDNKGVLYIHFHKQHRFVEDEIALVKIFSKRASDAIRHATAYTSMRNSARRLSVLNTVAQSLARTPRGENLLRDIAWITLNLFAADVVTIYEYIETENHFITPPEVAGKLKYELAMHTKVYKDDVPYKILKEKENVWAHDSINDPRLQSSGPKKSDGREAFVFREGIKTSAGVKLKVGAEIVGLMFINYRRKHIFDDDQKRVFLILASSAAIAIKNRRIIDLLSEVDKEILTITNLDIDSLLKSIVHKAVQMTMADIGEIRLVDYHKQGLVMRAKHPPNIPYTSSEKFLKLNQGVCGYVATSGKPLLLEDVSVNVHYLPCNSHTNSELCVPLIDKKQRTIGVLNMESFQKNTFDVTHQRMLESFATRAVIAIQNSNNQRRIAANQTMADVGIITSLITHKMFGDVGFVKEIAKDILNLSKNSVKIHEKADSIFNSADAIINDLQELFDLIKEDKHSRFNIRAAILSALSIVPRNGIKIEEYIDQNVGFLNFSEKQFVEAISNIIKNSLNAMPNGGILTIVGRKEITLKQSYIHIIIEDTGEGIPEEDRHKIFQPKFSRTKHGKGLGFGLWAVKKVVDRLGGKIEVESQVGKGTKFVLSIPDHDSIGNLI